MDRLEDWLGIRERQGRPPQVTINVKRPRRPRTGALIAKNRRLIAELSPELMHRLCGFIARGKMQRPFNYYIERLLSEALDQRGYQLHPGRGGGRVANTDIDLDPRMLG